MSSRMDNVSELSVISESIADATLVELDDKQPGSQQLDQPATKKELVCFFCFGVFNNFSYIIMLRYTYCIV